VSKLDSSEDAGYAIKLAKRLDKNRYIYAGFGLLDGLSLSYSSIKYFFDTYYTYSTISSTDAMHDWMMPLEGIFIVSAESFIIIFLSLTANYYEDKDRNGKDAAILKNLIIAAWPYIRDVLKGLKNAYKGIRSTFITFELLGVGGLNNLVLPVGLTLGIFSSLNRIWIRQMRNNRKQMMKENGKLLAQIYERALNNYSEVQGAKQELSERFKGMLAAFYGGVVDGMYLYMGILGVVGLPVASFPAVVYCCVMLTVSCILTRLYEEYNYQKQLEATATQIKVALYEKEIEDLFHKIQAIRMSSQTPDDNTHTEYALCQKLEATHKLFVEQCQLLTQNRSLSFFEATLSGLSNGLAIYSSLSAGLFAYLSICAIWLTPVSPFLIIGTVAAGIAFLCSFMIFSVYNNHFNQGNKKVIDEENKRTDTIISNIKEKNIAYTQITFEELRLAYAKQIVASEASSESDVQAFCEVIRSLFSGIPKGQKSIDFTCNSSWEVDEQGHYHESPFMLKLMIVAAFTYAVGLALRALARGWGKEKISSPKPPPKWWELPQQATSPELSGKDYKSNFASPRTMPKDFPKSADDIYCASRAGDSSTETTNPVTPTDPIDSAAPAPGTRAGQKGDAKTNLVDENENDRTDVTPSTSAQRSARAIVSQLSVSHHQNFFKPGLDAQESPLIIQVEKDRTCSALPA
jgi:uncharacterized membrane protein YhiD involved in acid resistance